MTKDEVLKIALEALEEAWYHVGTFQPTEKAIDLYDEARTAIKEALAQPEQDNAYIYASNLAKTIWQKHYMKESPKFALLDTTEGVLTQIDNMTCGLVREKPAQPEQEPVGKLQEPTAERAWFTIAELNAWANKKLLDNPQWVMPTEEPERKEALAQEQEPVAYLSNKRQRINIEIKPQTFVEIPTVTDWEMPLYMKPPQRTWVGLTDDDLRQIILVAIGVAEAKLKEKNT